MNNLGKLKIQLEELCQEKYADPPDDPLGDISHFELGIRRFCYECDWPVLIEIDGEEVIKAFLDPDICMLLEDELPAQVRQLARNEKIILDFPEIGTTLEMLPNSGLINCALQRWGYSVERKHFELERSQVLGVLRRFVEELMEIAVGGGYITPAEKEVFLKPMQEEPVSQEEKVAPSAG